MPLSPIQGGAIRAPMPNLAPPENPGPAVRQPAIRPQALRPDAAFNGAVRNGAGPDLQHGGGQGANFAANHDVGAGRDWDLHSAEGMLETARSSVSHIRAKVGGAEKIDAFVNSVIEMTARMIQGRAVADHAAVAQDLSALRETAAALKNARAAIVSGISEGGAEGDPRAALASLRKTLRVFRFETQKALEALGHEAGRMEAYEGSLREIQNCFTLGVGHHVETADLAEIARLEAELANRLADLRAHLAAGLELLKGLQTSRAPAGFIRHMIDATRGAPIDALAKLRRRSAPAEINRAILQLNANAVSILAGRDSGGLAEDGDTALACRHFLLRTMVSRLTESQRRGLRDALASQNAVQTVAFYDAVAADMVEMPEMAPSLHAHITTLDASPSISPRGTLAPLLAEATANSLNANIVRGAKKLATHPLGDSQFAIDRNRDFDVFLPDGTLLSTDPATVADELARFVTGRQDAAYANLGAAEKTKVHVVMSLLTQESSSAVFGAPSFALHPTGAGSTFNFGGNGHAQTRTFRLERDAAGGITVRYETTVRPTHLLAGTDTIELGAGSSISGGYKLTLTAEKLDTIGALDFAACDHTAADQAMNGNVEQKLRTAVNRLPPDFRLGLEPTTTFSAVLN